MIVLTIGEWPFRLLTLILPLFNIQDVLSGAAHG